jgi:hypothetical protein
MGRKSCAPDDGPAIVAWCLSPEKFAAKLDFEPDGSYSYAYIGTAANSIALLGPSPNARDWAKIEAILEREVPNMKVQPGVRAVRYKGNARYALHLEAKRAPAQPLNLLDIVIVGATRDGVVTIDAKDINVMLKDALAKSGIGVDATLDVTIPDNAEVIYHNATAAPALPGLPRTYSWRIDSIAPDLMMAFQVT